MSAKEFASGYTDQLDYLNRRMRPIVDRIIANSKTPPIIVIQADHGYKEHIEGTEDLTTPEMSSILSAFYLPGDNRQDPPDSISPVNTFRMIFRRYFGAEFGPLEDRTFTMEEKRGRVTLTRFRGG